MATLGKLKICRMSPTRSIQGAIDKQVLSPAITILKLAVRKEFSGVSRGRDCQGDVLRQAQSNLRGARSLPEVNKSKLFHRAVFSGAGFTLLGLPFAPPMATRTPTSLPAA